MAHIFPFVQFQFEHMLETKTLHALRSNDTENQGLVLISSFVEFSLHVSFLNSLFSSAGVKEGKMRKKKKTIKKQQQ